MSQWLLRTVALLVLHAVRPGAMHAQQEVPLAAVAQASVISAARVMNIVAHQDDDIGQMNPTLTDFVRAGKAVQTVFLTSGDAGFGCESYVVGRERGIKLAYEKMAGLAPGSNHWRPDALVDVAGKRVRLVAMAARPVTLIFVGLANTALASPNALLRMWHRELDQVASFPDSRTGGRAESYTREQLIDLLRTLIVEFNPQLINTLDGSDVWPPALPFEHPEHVATAHFASLARERAGGARMLRYYRGYNVLFEPANVSAERSALKQQVWDAYWPHDLKICRTVIVDVCPTGPRRNYQICDDPVGTYGGLMTREYFLERR